MTSQHDERRGRGANYTHRKCNRDCIKSNSLMANLPILFAKLQSVSIVFVVLIMKTDVVSYKLITSSIHKKVQLTNLNKGIALNANNIVSPIVLGFQNVKLKPISPLEKSLQVNISSFEGHDILSANDTQVFSTTTISTVKHGDLHYIAGRNENTPPPAENYKLNVMDINQGTYRVI